MPLAKSFLLQPIVRSSLPLILKCHLTDYREAVSLIFLLRAARTSVTACRTPKKKKRQLGRPLNTRISLSVNILTSITWTSRRLRSPQNSSTPAKSSLISCSSLLVQPRTQIKQLLMTRRIVRRIQRSKTKRRASWNRTHRQTSRSRQRNVQSNPKKKHFHKTPGVGPWLRRRASVRQMRSKLLSLAWDRPVTRLVQLTKRRRKGLHKGEVRLRGEQYMHLGLY